MGYCIAYGQTLIKETIVEPVKKKKAKVIVVLLVTGCILAGCIFARQSAALRRYILPGNPDVTAAALTGLVSDVRDGEPLGDAITAFCREIIENADLSD